MGKITETEIRKRIKPFLDINATKCNQYQCPEYGFNTKQTFKIDKKAYKYTCAGCGKTGSTYSNEAIYRTFKELFGYRYLKDKFLKEESCNNEECNNHNRSFKLYPSEYQKSGKTKSGSQRYKCKGCAKTFTKKKKPNRQRKDSINYKDKMIFMSIIHGLGIRRNAYLNEVSTQTIYSKLEFFYEQCLKFNLMMNEKISSKNHKTVRLSLDDISLTTNWRTNPRKSEKFISPKKKVGGALKLTITATVDNYTGFVFAQSLPFDSSVEANKINRWALKNGELDKKNILRENPHYTYIGEAEDGERYVNNLHGRNQKLIETYGIKVEDAYSYFSHIYYLKKLFKNSKRMVLYHDNFSSADYRLANMLNEREELDKFFIYLVDSEYHRKKDKNGNLKPRKFDSRENFIKEYKKYSKERKENYNNISKMSKKDWLKKVNELEHKVGKNIISERVKEAQMTEKNVAIEHPLPKQREPSKGITLLSDHLSNPHRVKYFLSDIDKANLNGVDNYFNNIRSMAFFKRSTKQLENKEHGKSEWKPDKAYDPLKIIMMSEIYKTYFNFIKIGKDKRTPAQRLGISNRVWKINDILTKDYSKLTLPH